MAWVFIKKLIHSLLKCSNARPCILNIKQMIFIYEMMSIMVAILKL